VNQASQEGAGRQDDTARPDIFAGFRDDSGTRSARIKYNICNRIGPDLDASSLEALPHGAAFDALSQVLVGAPDTVDPIDAVVFRPMSRHDSLRPPA